MKNNTKKCLVHGVQMPLREKDGKKWYSHGLPYKGSLIWCKGNGFINKGFGGRYISEEEIGNINISR
jgi:hypothetical protein